MSWSTSVAAMATKNVGGPARNDTRSAATNSRACCGSKRRTSTARRPAAPGTNTPLSSPEMCAMGAGMRTASWRPSPWTCAMSDAFQLRPRCECRTAFGLPVEPEVKSTRAMSEGRLPPVPVGTGSPPSCASSATGSDIVSDFRSRVRTGSTCARAAATSALPKECSTGHATAPSLQQARGSTAAARLFGTRQATASPRRTPLARKPPATRPTRSFIAPGDSRVSPSTTSPPCALSSVSRVGTSHGPPARR